MSIDVAADSAPSPSVAAPRHRRHSAWRTVVFAPIGDGSTRRRASDLVRLVLALVVVVTVLVLVANDGTLDVAVEKAVTPPPSGLDWILSAVWALGSSGAIAVVLVVALLSRRYRMARDVAVAGFGSVLACLALSTWLGPEGGRPASADLGGLDPAMPLVRIAVSIAVALAVAPYLRRWARRTLFTAVVLAAIAAVFQGHGFPLDVIGSIALGFGVAAAVHLALESPTGLPSSAEVLDAAAEVGLVLADVEPVRPQVWGVARFTAVSGGGPVDISIYGRDASDAQLLAKLWRFAWYRDSGPTLTLTRLQGVEHEAYLTMAAGRAGVTVPDVLVAAMVPSGDGALLVSRAPAGRPLAVVSADELDEARLDALFEEIARLRAAGIAHGAVGTATLLLTDGGEVALRDFRAASSSASADRLDRDVAAAMVAAAQVVGAERSVGAAVRTLGADAVSGALSQVQPAALDRATRRAMEGRKEVKALLGQVRAQGAAAAGVEEPKLAEIHRVSLSGLLMAIGAVVGLVLVVRQFASVGDIWETLQTALPVWVLATFLVAQSTNVAQAWSVMGSVSASLPFGPTLGLELANAYTGLVGGTVGTTATIIRFFQKRGLAVSVAVSSGVLVTLATMVTQTILFVTSFLVTRDDFTLSASSSSSSGSGGTTSWWVLVAIIVVAAAIGVVTVVPRFRHKVVEKVGPQVKVARDNLHDLRAQPGKLVRLFGGAAASQVLFAITLGCALKAYGASLPIGELIVINTLASLLGGIAPVPGGLGVIESGLIAGFTAAGVPSTTAVAATLTARTFTCYLPPVWGYPTLIWMRRREYL